MYAERVIVVTDNLVPFPSVPWQIQGNNVDCVVEVESIGDPAKIVSGTTQITRSPDRLKIAEYVARFVRDAGIMRPGFSFQAGAGGIALAFVAYLRDMMREAKVKARFVRGGTTKYLVELLQEGLTDYLLDGQTFDLDAVRSIATSTTRWSTSSMEAAWSVRSRSIPIILTSKQLNFQFLLLIESPGRRARAYFLVSSGLNAFQTPQGGMGIALPGPA